MASVMTVTIIITYVFHLSRKLCVASWMDRTLRDKVSSVASQQAIRSDAQ